jgi:hypothetical protein
MTHNPKTPNIKEFIKYLDQTLNLFEEHVPGTDFQNPDSNINKLFNTLFSMYRDISEHKKVVTKEPATKEPATKEPATKEPATKEPATSIINTQNMDDFNDIVAKHIANKKIKHSDNNSVNDTKLTSESNDKAIMIFNQGLDNLNTTTIGPLIRKNKTSKEKNEVFHDNIQNILRLKHQCELSTTNTLEKSVLCTPEIILSDIPAKKSSVTQKCDHVKISNDIPAKKPKRELPKEIFVIDSDLDSSNILYGDKTEDIDKKILQLKRILDR